MSTHRWSTSAVLVAALSGGASAAPAASPSAEPDGAPIPPDAANAEPAVLPIPAGDDAAYATAKAKAKGSDLEVGGRIFVRGDAVSKDGEPWESELAVDSVRIGVRYRWKDRLAAKIAIEVADELKLKDAYIDVAIAPGFEARAGQDKVPMSSIEQASAWTLPTVDRGVVADILSDGIALTGRREGAALRWSADPVRVILVASQSTTSSGGDPERPLSDGGGVALTASVELTPREGVRIAAAGSNREVADAGAVRRYWAGSLETELDFESDGVGLRLWADVLAGTSQLGTVLSGDDSEPFVAAQLSSGWRFGGAKRGGRYAEPFIAGALFDPNWSQGDDAVTELMAGVNVGAWRKWRVQSQVSIVNVGDQRPSNLAGAQDDVDDRIAATLQIGTAF